jgi:Holliday junction resolvase RusA-like endonuclease
MPTLIIEHNKPAKPQGSKSGFIRGGRVVMVEASKNLKLERDELSEVIAVTAYKDKWVQPNKDTPVSVSLLFVFERPKSALARMFHTVKPDVDKLMRFSLDAITNAKNVWIDDSQVTHVIARKEYGAKAKTQIVISYGETE